MACSRSRVVLAIVAVTVLALATSAGAAVISHGATAPVVDGEDIASLLATPTGADKWWPGTSTEYGNPGKTVGQTFTTGSNDVVLDAITFQIRDHTEPTKVFPIRVGTVSGSTFTEIASESATLTDAWGDHAYVTWTLDSPVSLSANTTYGVDVGLASSTSAWQSGIPYVHYTGDAYSDGTRFRSGTAGFGVGDDTMSHMSGDRVFHLNMTAVASGGRVRVVLPTGDNWNFETGAAGFVQSPGYISPINPSNPAEITSWPGSGSRGINPGSFGSAPFRNNGSNSTNVAFIQGAGSIGQAISGWEVGEEYRVAFDYNSRSGFAAPGMTATIGSASLTDAVIPAVGGANSYYAGNLVFTATNATETLTITNLDNPGDDTLLVDNIRVFRNGPTIADNGFENPVQPDNNWEQASGAGGGSLVGSAWTIIGNAGITRNKSAFQGGTNGIPAPEGDQHALIQATGSFSQTVTDFVVGADYTLSLLTMARQAGAGGNDLEVVLDAGLPSEIMLLDMAEVTFNRFMELESAWFLAAKDTYELTIRATLDGGNLAGDRTTFFDNVWFNQQTLIPEPATLSLLGLGALLALRRRRRLP